ncbi:hypothetical protein [Actibacterium sp. 188UL27-1]|uniref:hypothetical protein n=1 Tax=Actibacterium sp. 188UL27-1 TaxID=2786961 RepID=UPI00195B10DE|nr:hypothetical protein [Actibacterium sp. 188UL27-1]MBM7069422.1 hypothetical protein [Actibacterium sp. 188UL27-1]
MSDSMARAEIDDVLSSIRRLVSNDTRCLKPTNMDDPAVSDHSTVEAPVEPDLPAPDQTLGEALILSPSIRVADEIVPAEDLDPKPAFTPVTGIGVLGETPWIADADKVGVPELVPAADIDLSLADIVRPTPMALVDPLPQQADDLDQAALEAAVAALVRSELQGPLGARITLIVRKLVRQEIGRVLDEHNLK